MQDLDLAANRVAQRFDQRHPVLSGLVVSLLFASIGLLSVLFAGHLIRTEASGLLVAAMIVGTGIGAGGAGGRCLPFPPDIPLPAFPPPLPFRPPLPPLL